MHRRHFSLAIGTLLFLVLVAVLLGAAPTATAQTFGCTPAMANDIVCENSKTGNPSSDWDVEGGGDDTIQGFATTISVNQGQTVYFKINTDAKAYTIEIYRMGYYAGLGARKVASVTPSAKLPQTQPACVTDSTTNLVDCGNWAISASWAVPSNATSGIYFAHLIRTDTGGDSHIVFIVRNDSSHSAILFQTSDGSWVAYNDYGTGGYSLYGDNQTFDLPNRAYKLSYNRPFITRGFENESATWVFGAEYPMVRWLESNGYDVTYFTGIDAAISGSLIQNHRIYTSTGHDEYWSGPQRTNVQAARDAGVNMSFFSGNEVFWKTRLENSIDGNNTPNRTLVCYKETLAFAKIDPKDPPTWTGTWRDPSFSPPADGGNPENSLTGTLFMVNGPGTDNPGSLSITVPAADGKMRFWRNTAIASLAPNSSYTLPSGTLGYEWDVDADNGARPAGAFQLSTTTYPLTLDYLLDWGATYGAGSATHHLMMYRAKSGALVFGAGTVQWSWGLDSNHDNSFGFSNPDPDVNMQQATVNLFADMGVQPASLQAGLVPATKSTDTIAPTSKISSPASGGLIPVGVPAVISGTATDSGGGVVGGVEVSVNGGQTWHPATGRSSWTYTWAPTVIGTFTILSRAVDDSANLETPSAGISVTVSEHDCPCDGWNSSSTPALIDSDDGSSVEVGVRFRADYNGYITGVRFYKSSTNVGTHVGNLWTNTGTLLSTAIFTNESASGWQQVNFATPVAITANTTYVASYFAPDGHYSVDSDFFATKGQDNPPMHLLQNGVDGPNGIYSYSSSSVFPSSTYNSANYWVDVVYIPATSMPGAPPSLLATPQSLSFAAFLGLPNPSSQTISLYNQGSGVINWTTTSTASWLAVSPASGTTPATLSVSANPSGLAAGNYSATLTITGAGSSQTISVTLTVSNLFLYSNFATSDLEGWVPSPLGLAGNWSISNSTLNYNGAGPTQLYAGNSAWTNYSVSAKFKLSSLLNYPGGIRGRINATTGASYIAWIYPATGTVGLWKNTTWNIDTGSLVQLGLGKASFDTTNFHNLQMSFAGSQIQVFYDGNLVITATDTANTSGYVALDVYNQAISYSQVLVTSSLASTGTFTASPASLTFSTNYLAANPAAQTLQVASSASALAWTAVSSASWLTVSPVNGLSPATLQVAVSSSTLNPGTYTGTVQVVSLGALATTQVIPVTLNVIAPPPTLLASPGSLSFVALTGQPAPAAQFISVTNAGSGGFNYTVSASSPWIVLSPTSGAEPGAVSVTVNATGLAMGSYSGTVTVTATGIANSPVTIPVSMQVLTQELSENFSGLGAGWIVSPMGNAAGWSASNGVYTYNGAGLSQTCAGNSAWTNYVFDTNIKLTTLNNWPGGVRARVNPATGAGYFVWLYPGSGLAILWRVGAWSVNDPSLTELGSAPLSFDTTTTHDLTLAFNGSQITVSWDGRPLITATDATYTQGYVCLDADSQPISYSNVRVESTQPQVTIAAPSPSSLLFAAVPGAAPTSQVLNISAGGASTTWAVVTSNQSWLTSVASSTLTPGTLTVTANPTGLTEGTYTGTVTIYAPGATNSPLVIPVTFGVKTAVMSVTPTTLNFFGAIGLNPNPQPVNVTNIGTGVLNWAATATQSWDVLSASTGAAPASISVSPIASGLANGIHTDTITVSSSDVSNSPAQVSVSFLVGNLLFNDNFSEGTGNWTVGPLGYSSGWSIVNGMYTYNGEGPTQSWAGNSTWTDYTVGVDFKLASLNNNPGGIRGRMNPSTGAGYAVWIYPAQGLLKLYRVDQWNIDTSYALLGVPASVSMNTNTHNIRLEFQGTTIQVYYDNVLVITATDATYAQGVVALDVSNQPVSYADVTVISAP
jgi:Domain of unknown function (DUF4082)/Viral BACON domain/Bacterial Ig domain/Putative binding domain, N-terminal